MFFLDLGLCIKVSTGKKLLIMFAIMAMVIIAVLVSHSIVISRLQDKLVEEESTEKQHSVEYAIEQSKSFLSKFAEDYTLWDEMVDYITNPNDEWISHNITPLFQTTPIEYVWIIKTTDSLPDFIYLSEKDGFTGILNSVNWSDFDNNFVDEDGTTVPVFYFYTFVGNQLIEMAASKVFMSDNYDRSGKSSGYFIIGKSILTADIDVLENVTNSELKILQTITVPEPEDKYQNVIAVKLEDFSKEHIGNMVFTSEQTMHKATMEAARKIFNNLIIILGFGIFFAIWFVSRTVTKPLDKIKSGLDSQSLEPVVELLERKDEFGEIAQLIKRIKEQEKELKELNATKDKFFSIIAHDLKNPFGVILSTTEILSNPDFELSEEEVEEFTRDLHASAKLVFNLLENLLTWARTQRGTISFDPQEILLYELAEMPIYILKSHADSKNIKLINNIEKSTKCFGDENMVRTVIRNLISNSIKFTRDGGCIEIYSRPLTIGNHHHVEVVVKDNGIGMSDVIKNKLFKVGENITTSGTSDEGGTGLGLILVQEFLTRNGGTIRVESEEGVGSKFIFTLPVQ